MIDYESQGDGPAIVFAHGVGGNHASWFQQVPVFSKSYRVVAFDHRGFGRSGDPDQKGRAGFVDDLKELLDELAIDKACLVGQSMGGGTVIGFAGRYPERVSALVVCDLLFGIELPDAMQARFDEARAQAAGLDQLERVLGRAFPESKPEKTCLYQALASFNATNRGNLEGEWGREYTPAELQELGVPILFVVGEADPAGTAEAGARAVFDDFRLVRGRNSITAITAPACPGASAGLTTRGYASLSSCTCRRSFALSRRSTTELEKRASAS